MKLTVTTICCVVLLLSSAAAAGGLDASMVSADARWLVHLDVKGLLTSRFGLHILEEVDARGHDQAVSRFAERVGFDPRTDLDSVTLWGMGYDPDSGVAVIRGRVDKETLLAFAARNEGYAEAEYGEYVLYRWTQRPENRRDDGVRWGTFWADDVVLITRNREVLELAVETLDDPSATMAGLAGVPMGFGVSYGAFLVAAGEDIPVPARHGIIAEDLSAGFVELGEENGTMFLNITATALTEKDGSDFRYMAQGILALSRMKLRQREKQDKPLPVWAPLARSAAVTGTGATVSLGVALNTEDVITMIRAAREGRRERMQDQP